MDGDEAHVSEGEMNFASQDSAELPDCEPGLFGDGVGGDAGFTGASADGFGELVLDTSGFDERPVAPGTGPSPLDGLLASEGSVAGDFVGDPRTGFRKRSPVPDALLHGVER